MTRHVLGFAFYKDHVLLVKGSGNQWKGIGGEIEDEDDDEAPKAMRREFQDQTGYDSDEWKFVGEISFKEASVKIYRTVLGEFPWPETNDVGESLGFLSVEDFDVVNVAENVPTIVQHCLTGVGSLLLEVYR